MSFFKKLFGKSENNPQPTPPPAPEPAPETPQRRGNPETVMIYPRVKAHIGQEGPQAFVEKHQQLTPMDIPEPQQPYMLPLYEDLSLAFVIDRGAHYEYVNKELIRNNPQLTPEVLRQISMNALLQLIGEKIQLHGSPEHGMMVTVGGDFESCLILADNFWDQILPMLGENAVIAIPANDLLFICRESDQDAIGRMKQTIANTFQNPDTKGLLSTGLYLRSPGDSTLKLIDRVS